VDSDVRLSSRGRSKFTRPPAHLESLVFNARPPVRAEAAQALARLQGARALPVLARLVEDPEPDVALAAVGALGLLGSPDALAILLEIRKNGPPDYANRPSAR